MMTTMEASAPSLTPTSWNTTPSLLPKCCPAIRPTSGDPTISSLDHTVFRVLRPSIESGHPRPRLCLVLRLLRIHKPSPQEFLSNGKPNPGKPSMLSSPWIILVLPATQRQISAPEKNSKTLPTKSSPFLPYFSQCLVAHPITTTTIRHHDLRLPGKCEGSWA